MERQRRCSLPLYRPRTQFKDQFKQTMQSHGVPNRLSDSQMYSCKNNPPKNLTPMTVHNLEDHSYQWEQKINPEGGIYDQYHSPTHTGEAGHMTSQQNVKYHPIPQKEKLQSGAYRDHLNAQTFQEPQAVESNAWQNNLQNITPGFSQKLQPRKESYNPWYDVSTNSDDDSYTENEYPTASEYSTPVYSEACSGTESLPYQQQTMSNEYVDHSGDFTDSNQSYPGNITASQLTLTNTQNFPPQIPVMPTLCGQDCSKNEDISPHYGKDGTTGPIYNPSLQRQNGEMITLSRTNFDTNNQQNYSLIEEPVSTFAVSNQPKSGSYHACSMRNDRMQYPSLQPPAMQMHNKPKYCADSAGYSTGCRRAPHSSCGCSQHPEQVGEMDAQVGQPQKEFDATNQSGPSTYMDGHWQWTLFEDPQPPAVLSNHGHCNAPRVGKAPDNPKTGYCDRGATHDSREEKQTSKRFEKYGSSCEKYDRCCPGNAPEYASDPEDYSTFQHAENTTPGEQHCYYIEQLDTDHSPHSPCQHKEILNLQKSYKFSDGSILCSKNRADYVACQKNAPVQQQSCNRQILPIQKTIRRESESEPSGLCPSKKERHIAQTAEPLRKKEFVQRVHYVMVYSMKNLCKVNMVTRHKARMSLVRNATEKAESTWTAAYSCELTIIPSKYRKPTRTGNAAWDAHVEIRHNRRTSRVCHAVPADKNAATLIAPVSVGKPCLQFDMADASTDVIQLGDGTLYRGRPRSRTNSANHSAELTTEQKSVEIPNRGKPEERKNACFVNRDQKVDGESMTYFDAKSDSGKSNINPESSAKLSDSNNKNRKCKHRDKEKTTQCPVVKAHLCTQLNTSADSKRDVVERSRWSVTESPQNYIDGKYFPSTEDMRINQVNQNHLSDDESPPSVHVPAHAHALYQIPDNLLKPTEAFSEIMYSSVEVSEDDDQTSSQLTPKQLVAGDCKTQALLNKEAMQIKKDCMQAKAISYILQLARSLPDGPSSDSRVLKQQGEELAHCPVNSSSSGKNKHTILMKDQSKSSPLVKEKVGNCNARSARKSKTPTIRSKNESCNHDRFGNEREIQTTLKEEFTSHKVGKNLDVPQAHRKDKNGINKTKHITASRNVNRKVYGSERDALKLCSEKRTYMRLCRKVKSHDCCCVSEKAELERNSGSLLNIKICDSPITKKKGNKSPMRHRTQTFKDLDSATEFADDDTDNLTSRCLRSGSGKKRRRRHERSEGRGKSARESSTLTPQQRSLMLAQCQTGLYGLPAAMRLGYLPASYQPLMYSNPITPHTGHILGHQNQGDFFSMTAPEANLIDDYAATGGYSMYEAQRRAIVTPLAAMQYRLSQTSDSQTIKTGLKFPVNLKSSA